MCKFKAGKISPIGFLLVALVAAECANYNKNAGNPGAPLTPPTVISVTPPGGSTLASPGSMVITATFSKAMNPATINASTFTLTFGGR